MINNTDKQINKLAPEYEPYIKAVFARKAENVIALDVSKQTSYTDMLIICSARSNRQASAIAESIKIDLKKADIKPLGIDGQKEGQWVLLDYGHVIIHVFYHETREYYDIEGLWADAERYNIDCFKTS